MATLGVVHKLPLQSGYRSSCKLQLLSNYRIWAKVQSSATTLWRESLHLGALDQATKLVNMCVNSQERSTFPLQAMQASLEPRSHDGNKFFGLMALCRHVCQNTHHPSSLPPPFTSVWTWAQPPPKTPSAMALA